MCVCEGKRGREKGMVREGEEGEGGREGGIEREGERETERERKREGERD